MDDDNEQYSNQVIIRVSSCPEGQKGSLESLLKYPNIEVDDYLITRLKKILTQVFTWREKGFSTII